jgi:uncharacterized membrane protein
LGEKEKQLLRQKIIFCLLAVGLYVGLRLWNFAGNDLWADEVFSILTAQLNWTAMFAALISDAVHPPLFYILLKSWILLGGETVAWLRLFPVIVSILTLLPLYLLCRQLNLTLFETNIAVVLMAVNGFFLDYAFDLRMYGLVQLLTLSSLWLFAKFNNLSAKSQNTLIALSAVNLLLVFTHYFGWLVILGEGFYLIIRRKKRLKEFLFGVLPIVLLFLPWALMIIRAIGQKENFHNLDWLTRPGFRELIWFYATLNGIGVAHTTLIGLCVFGLPILIWSWRVRQQADLKETWSFLFFFAFAPVLLVFLLSNLLPKSIWEERYLIVSAAPYLLLAVKSATELPLPRYSRIFPVFILTWALTTALYQFSQGNGKTKWNEVVQTIEQGNQAPNKIYAVESFVDLPLRFYLHPMNKSRLEIVRNTDQIKEKSFQLVVRSSAWQETKSPPEILKDKGCRINLEKEFIEPREKVILLQVEDCSLKD